MVKHFENIADFLNSIPKESNSENLKNGYFGNFEFFNFLKSRPFDWYAMLEFIEGHYYNCDKKDDENCDFCPKITEMFNDMSNIWRKLTKYLEEKEKSNNNGISDL